MSSRLAAGGAGAAAVLGLLAALHGWRDLDYWNYSEGVYALTSRLLLDGRDLYGDVVVAQPPGVPLAGAGILAIEDSITWLRLAVGALQALTAGLAALAVWRLTGRAFAAALAAPLALVTPWAVHEHGLLTPEVVGAPLLMAGALFAARPGRGPLAGVLLALAVFTKLPFALPAVLVAAVARDRRACLVWLAGASALQAVVWTVVFGPSMWDDVVLAQQGTGLRTIREVAEYGSQAAWNLIGLLVPAIAAVSVLRAEARDRDLLRTLAALAAGLLLTLLTVAKNGTSINVAVPVEAALVALAVPGLVWAVAARPRRRALAAVAGAGIVLALVQSASLLTDPGEPRPFLRPDASSGVGRTLGTRQVEARAARARRCPSGLPYSGPPFLAFVAGRRMPDDQPDGFLTAESSRLAAVAVRAEADRPRCP